MKRLILILCSLLLLVSCKKDIILTVDPSYISFYDVGGMKEINITCNDEWTFGSFPNWISATQVSGKGSAVVTILCKSNSTYATRSTVLIIESGDIRKEINIEQDINYETQVNTSQIDLSPKSQISFFELNTNEDVEITCDVDWIEIVNTKQLTSRIVEFMVDENNVENVRKGAIHIKSSNSGSENTIIVSQSGTNNLSQSGNANCYIISKKGYYKFNPTIGNSTESIESIFSAEVLWETNNTLEVDDTRILEDVYLGNDGYIYLTYSGTEGNALIAAKDKSGEILWSWHIWCLNGYDPVDKARKYLGGKFAMDRNLGALSSEIGSPLTKGLLYQWGRKDPFLGGASFNNNDLISSYPRDAFGYVQRDEITGTIQYAVAHPTIFIDACDHSQNAFTLINNSWLHNHIDTLWSTTKTIYDPCPVGWKIPDSNRMMTSGLWYGFGGISPTFVDGGIVVSTPYSTPDTYYPYTGEICDGEYIYSDFVISAWNTCTSTNPGLGDYYWVMYFYLNGSVRRIQTTIGSPMHGAAVRCQIE